MKQALIVLAALAILSLPLTSRAQDHDDTALDLRLRLNPGDKYQFVISTEKTAAHWFHDAETTSSSTMTLWLTTDVLGVAPDGATDVKLTFDRIALTTQSPDARSEYDSQKVGENDNLKYPFILYQALIGQSFQATISLTGEALTSRQSDAMQTAIADARAQARAKAGPSTATFVQDKTTHALRLCLRTDPDPVRLTNEQCLKQLVASLLFVRPDKPIALGDTWTREENVSTDPTLTCTNTYKLAARQDGVATIESKGTLQHDPAMTAGGHVTTVFGMRLKMEGTRSGTVKLDETSGTIIEARVTDSLKGELKGSDADEEDESTPIPVTTDVITTISCHVQDS